MQLVGIALRMRDVFKNFREQETYSMSDMLKVISNVINERAQNEKMFRKFFYVFLHRKFGLIHSISQISINAIRIFSESTILDCRKYMLLYYKYQYAHLVNIES